LRGLFTALLLFDFSPTAVAAVITAVDALAILGIATDGTAAAPIALEIAPLLATVPLDLGAVATFGTALPTAVVADAVLALAALAAADPTAGDLEEAFDEARFELLLGSTLRFLLTVFFLTVVPAIFLVSVEPFFEDTFDFPPAPPVDFLLIVLPLDAVELELPVAAEDDGFGGGAMPINRSSSKILSSGASIDPPILDSLRRFD
jgi:hypothetical protein